LDAIAKAGKILKVLAGAVDEVVAVLLGVVVFPVSSNSTVKG